MSLPWRIFFDLINIGNSRLFQVDGVASLLAVDTQLRQYLLKDYNEFIITKKCFNAFKKCIHFKWHNDCVRRSNRVYSSNRNLIYSYMCSMCTLNVSSNFIHDRSLNVILISCCSECLSWYDKKYNELYFQPQICKLGSSVFVPHIINKSSLDYYDDFIEYIQSMKQFRCLDFSPLSVESS